MNRDEIAEFIRRETMTAAEAADHLGIPVARLEKWVREGRLRPVKGDLFLRRDVEARREGQEALRRRYGFGSSSPFVREGLTLEEYEALQCRFEEGRRRLIQQGE